MSSRRRTKSPGACSHLSSFPPLSFPILFFLLFGRPTSSSAMARRWEKKGVFGGSFGEGQAQEGERCF